jgi:S1-C subfamily serine protease
MAIGNPYGLDGTVTVGVVSGIGRTDLGISHFENFIQTDASINPGNSGGPLINLDGQIVGINTAVAAIGSGVGFAIPVEMALRVGDQLIHKGSVDRGWLGIGIQDLTPELAYNFSLNTQDGVLVNSIENKTPAQLGGMLRGDIIIQFDGKIISSLKYFQKLVADTAFGKMVPVKILRDGKEKILQIKIGKMPS